MALPASMTPVALGGGADRLDARREIGVDEGWRGTRTEGSRYIDEDEKSALAAATIDDDGDVEMDDDEVLRVLSLLGEDEEGDEEEKEEEEEEGDQGESADASLIKEVNQILDRSSVADDAGDWRGERVSSDLDPARQLQQRLKKAYSRSKNPRGRSSAIGADVFEVVDSSSRVRDIRKSQLSSTPPPSAPSSRAIFSAPLTETAGSGNRRSIEPAGTGGALTVAEALEALKKPFPSASSQRDRDRPRGGGGMSFTQPVGAVFDTNTRLRTMAESPSGTSYSGEEIDRAIR
jgi:hypothetical protein